MAGPESAQTKEFKTKVNSYKDFESVLKRLADRCENFAVVGANISQKEFRAVLKSFLETVNKASAAVEEAVTKKVPTADFISIARRQIKDALEPLQDDFTEGVVFKDGKKQSQQISIKDLRLHSFVESRLNLADAIAGGNDLAAQQAFLNLQYQDATLRLPDLQDDLEKLASERVKNGGSDLRLTKESDPLRSAAELTPDELQALINIQTKGSQWLVSTETLQRYLEASTQYKGNRATHVPIEGPTALRQELLELQQRGIDPAAYTAPLTKDRVAELLDVLNRILEISDDPNVIQIKKVIRDYKVYPFKDDYTGENYSTFISRSQRLLEVALGSGDPDVIKDTLEALHKGFGDMLSYLDQRLASLKGTQYVEDASADYNKKVDAEIIRFIQDEEKGINDKLDQINALAGSGSGIPTRRRGTIEQGSHPPEDPDWAYTDAKDYFESLKDPDYVLERAMKFLAELQVGGTRSTKAANNQTVDHKIWPRFHAAIDVLRSSAGGRNGSSEYHHSFSYLAEKIDHQRIAYDFDLDYAKTIAFSNLRPDDLGPESALGIYPTTFDWFFDAKAPETERYQYAEQFMAGLKIMGKLFMEDTRGKYKGRFASKFKENLETKVPFKKAVSAELVLAYPDKAELFKLSDSSGGESEFMTMLVQVAGTLGIFPHYFADRYASGTSPENYIARIKDLIHDCNPIAKYYYRDYKHIRFNSMAETVKLPGAWIALKKRREDIDHQRIEHIEESDHGSELILESIAPLRRRRETPTHWEADALMLNNVFPDLFEFAVNNIEERRNNEAPSFFDWTQARKGFVAYIERSRGLLPSASKFKDKKKYRDALIHQVEELLSVNISGMKAIRYMDYRFVADEALSMIDRVFRAYAQKDENNFNIDDLMNGIIRVVEGPTLKSAAPNKLQLTSDEVSYLLLDNKFNSLKTKGEWVATQLLTRSVDDVRREISAGPDNGKIKIIEEAGAVVQIKVTLESASGGQDTRLETVFDASGVVLENKITFQNYLRENLRMVGTDPLASDNKLRKKPVVQNAKNDLPMGSVYLRRRQAAEYILFRMNPENRNFHPSTTIFGEGKDDQKATPDEATEPSH